MAQPLRHRPGLLRRIWPRPYTRFRCRGFDFRLKLDTGKWLPWPVVVAPFWIKADIEGNNEWEFVWQENNYFGGECGKSIEDGHGNFYGTCPNGYHPGVPCLYMFSATGQQMARHDMMGDTIEHGVIKTISMFHDSATLAQGGWQQAFCCPLQHGNHPYEI